MEQFNAKNDTDGEIEKKSHFLHFFKNYCLALVHDTKISFLFYYNFLKIFHSNIFSFRVQIN